MLSSQGAASSPTSSAPASSPASSSSASSQTPSVEATPSGLYEDTVVGTGSPVAGWGSDVTTALVDGTPIMTWPQLAKWTVLFLGAAYVAGCLYQGKSVLP